MAEKEEAGSGKGKTAEFRPLSVCYPRPLSPDRHRQPTANKPNRQPQVNHGPTMGFTHDAAILPCARRVGAEMVCDAAKAPCHGRSRASLLPMVADRKKYEGITETAILRVQDMLACQSFPVFSKHAMQIRVAVQTRVCAAPNDASLVFFRYPELAVSYHIVH